MDTETAPNVQRRIPLSEMIIQEERKDFAGDCLEKVIILKHYLI